MLLQDAVFQRTHLTTHLISEYTFTQTTGSSSSSENNAHTVHEEPTNDDQDDLAHIETNAASIQADNPRNDQKPLPVGQGADNVRERSAYGSTDVV